MSPLLAAGLACLTVVILVVLAIRFDEWIARRGWEPFETVDVDGEIWRNATFSLTTRNRLETVAEFLADDIDQHHLYEAVIDVIHDWDNNEETETVFPLQTPRLYSVGGAA